MHNAMPHMTLRDSIFNTALHLARTRGVQNVMRGQIAYLLGCSEGVVSYHFKTMCALRDALMTHAIKEKDLALIAQGYVTRHPIVMKAPEALLRRAMSGQFK